MIVPDARLIGEVMLFAQGFRAAEALSSKVGLLFKLCNDQLSAQAHYDFGLRALKSVLRSAGALKRQALADAAADADASGGGGGGGGGTGGGGVRSADWWSSFERGILVKALCATVVPKLVAGDVSLFSTLLKVVFPDAVVATPHAKALRRAVVVACERRRLTPSRRFVDKCLQLNQVRAIAVCLRRLYMHQGTPLTDKHTHTHMY
jgi:dynein heavy chain 1